VYAAAGNDHSAVPITVDQLLDITGGEEVDVCDLPENR
jgi:prolyl-tRNA editing enzyme YbaK/EbsC (Cys-tRNA(Pro) deacylase)